MKRFRLSILAFAVVLGTSAAFAATGDLNLGGSYVDVTVDESGVGPTDVGGGPITISYLNGAQLSYVFCVGFFTDVYVPDDYPDTTITSNGFVNGATVNNDVKIADLLANYDTTAFVAASTTNDQALQAAIWSLEYDGANANNDPAGTPTIAGDSGQGYYGLYNELLAQASADTAGLTASQQTALLARIDWFSPGDGSGTVYQGLVAPGLSPAPPVPEPTSVLLLGTLVLFSVGSIRRKRLSARQ